MTPPNSSDKISRMKRKPITYESAGVSIAANDKLIDLLIPTLRKTENPRVISNPGGFAGFFRLFDNRTRYKDPILVSCTDGVGTKVLLAAQMNRLDTIGTDLVAMSVNDMITCGARPLFFLDYVAAHKNIPPRTAAIVASVARGCRQADCVLLGGETAEMPDLYKPDEFDLAGFAVGVVERKHLITGRSIRPGDVLIGLASSGIHSNGYSLVRHVFFEKNRYRFNNRIQGLRGTLGQELLRPTRIYVRPILSLLQKHPAIIRGLAHITGSGLPGNVPRILPKGCQAVIRKESWKIPPIFRVIQSLGVSEKQMYDVFNMGIGMVLVCRSQDAPQVLAEMRRSRVPARVIGEIVRGDSERLILDEGFTEASKRSAAPR